jgi:hypothetical protein
MRWCVQTGDRFRFQFPGSELESGVKSTANPAQWLLSIQTWSWNHSQKMHWQLCQVLCTSVMTIHLSTAGM